MSESPLGHHTVASLRQAGVHVDDDSARGPAVRSRSSHRSRAAHRHPGDSRAALPRCPRREHHRIPAHRGAPLRPGRTRPLPPTTTATPSRCRASRGVAPRGPLRAARTVASRHPPRTHRRRAPARPPFRLGHTDLAETITDRLRWCADHAANPVLDAVAAWTRAGAFQAAGDYNLGLTVLDAACTALHSSGDADPAATITLGSLHLRAVTIAARDHTETSNHLDQARALAENLATRQNHHGAVSTRIGAALLAVVVLLPILVLAAAPPGPCSSSRPPSPRSSPAIACHPAAPGHRRATTPTTPCMPPPTTSVTAAPGPAI